MLGCHLNVFALPTNSIYRIFKMSSAFDNINTAPQVHGTMQPTAVIEHTQDPNSIGSSVDEVVKPTEAERAPSDDNATKADAADQSSVTSTSADQKAQEVSDKAVDNTAVVQSEKRDPPTELDRYKRRFQIWQVEAFLLALSTNLILL